MMRCAERLTPLYDLMCDRVRASFALHADDTLVVLLNPRRLAYAWVYSGDRANPYTVFDLSPGRQQGFPEKFLAGYRGYIHADAYAGYNQLYTAGATHVGCWAHARRGFFETKGSDPTRSHKALARIRLLYAVETEAKAKGLTGAELAAYRRERVGPALQSFADWLAAEVPRVLPKSIFDVATNKSLGRIEVGPHPHGIAVPAAQNFILVTIEGRTPGELVWIDQVTDKITPAHGHWPGPQSAGRHSRWQDCLRPGPGWVLRGHRPGERQGPDAHLHWRPAAQHTLLPRWQAHVPGAHGRAQAGNHRGCGHAQANRRGSVQ
jgi:hypothetical protein